MRSSSAQPSIRSWTGPADGRFSVAIPHGATNLLPQTVTFFRKSRKSDGLQPKSVPSDSFSKKCLSSFLRLAPICQARQPGKGRVNIEARTADAKLIAHKAPSVRMNLRTRLWHLVAILFDRRPTQPRFGFGQVQACWSWLKPLKPSCSWQNATFSEPCSSQGHYWNSHLLRCLFSTSVCTQVIYCTWRCKLLVSGFCSLHANRI